MARGYQPLGLQAANGSASEAENQTATPAANWDTASSSWYKLIGGRELRFCVVLLQQQQKQHGTQKRTAAANQEDPYSREVGFCAVFESTRRWAARRV